MFLFLCLIALLENSNIIIIEFFSSYRAFSHLPALEASFYVIINSLNHVAGNHYVRSRICKVLLYLIWEFIADLFIHLDQSVQCDIIIHNNTESFTIDLKEGACKNKNKMQFHEGKTGLSSHELCALKSWYIGEGCLISLRSWPNTCQPNFPFLQYCASYVSY